MHILLDECLPRRLKNELPAHDISTVQEMGWASLKDKELLTRIGDQFDVFITIDRGIQHQQNLCDLRFAVIVLGARSNRLEHILPLAPFIHKALSTIQPGDVIHINALS